LSVIRMSARRKSAFAPCVRASYGVVFSARVIMCVAGRVLLIEKDVYLFTPVRDVCRARASSSREAGIRCFLAEYA